MDIRYLPSLIMLVAGAIACIFSIVRGWDVTYSLIVLLIVLIVFLILGKLAQKLILSIMEGNMIKKSKQERESSKEVEIEIEQSETQEPGDDSQQTAEVRE